MLLVVILLGYYIWKGAVSPHWEALLLIFLLLLWLGCMGMGVGILISSVTTKYRDLSVLVGFGMSLWMYGTPVVYPMSILPEGILKKIILLNPGHCSDGNVPLYFTGGRKYSSGEYRSFTSFYNTGNAGRNSRI